MSAERETTVRLAPKEVAAELGVTDFTLYCWRKKRIGPPFFRQIGRVWYPRDQLTKWREQNTQMCDLAE